MAQLEHIGFTNCPFNAVYVGVKRNKCLATKNTGLHHTKQRVLISPPLLGEGKGDVDLTDFVVWWMNGSGKTVDIMYGLNVNSTHK